MTMSAFVRYLPAAAELLPWLLNLATWLVARSLNMPEPLVHATGLFVFVRVQDFENAFLKALCPPASHAPSPGTAPSGAAIPNPARRPSMIMSSQFLRRALLADAVFSGVSAIALTLDASALAPFLNLPEALLRETGLFLIAYTALVGWLWSRPSVPKVLVMIVIAGNAAWTLASVALLFSGAVAPNLLGEIVVVAQAIATGVLAELQYIGLRKSTAELMA
jgi:hypothetical protein